MERISFTVQKKVDNFIVECYKTTLFNIISNVIFILRFSTLFSLINSVSFYEDEQRLNFIQKISWQKQFWVINLFLIY